MTSGAQRGTKLFKKSISLNGAVGDGVPAFDKKLLDLKRQVKSTISLDNLQEKGISMYGLKLEFEEEFVKRLLYCTEWGDVERSYYNSVLKIMNYKVDDSFDSEQKKLSQMRSLNKEFEYVRGKLIDYLKEENNCVPELLNKKSWFTQLFSGLLTGDSHQGETLDFVVNFNYTKTVEIAIANQETGNWVHRIDIHGRLEEEELSPPIFGYGDDVDSSYRSLEDLNHSEYFKFFKSHYYSRDSNYSKMLQFLEGSFGTSPYSPAELRKKATEFEVHIIGHSCGISDRTMLKTIFEHDNCAAIYNYHWRDNEEEALKDHFEKDINVSRHFDDKIKKRDRFKPFDFSLKY